MSSTRPETAVLTDERGAAPGATGALSGTAADEAVAAPASRASSAPERFAAFTGAVHRALPARLRRFIPPIGGMDLTPIALILAIVFVQSFLSAMVQQAVGMR